MLLASLLLGAAYAVCPLKLMGAAEREQFVEEERRRRAIVADPVDAGTTTVQGCKCTSTCGATADDLFKCDWCYTADSCGHFAPSRLGYYDWCVYNNEPSYESQTWKQKMDYLWGKVIADKTSGEYENKLKVVSESVQTTFDDQRDWMPAGRFKVIHAVGAHCKVAMKITSTKYTGIFAEGSQEGFFRFGSAVDPTTDGCNPGAGFKFLRSGVKSANWVMLDDPNLTDVKDFNMFDRNLTNHVSAFQGVQNAVALKFKQVSNCVTKVGLSDAAKYRQDGTKEASPVFPWMLTMQPSDPKGVTMSSGITTIKAFIDGIINAIPKGTTFYDVYATETPQSFSAQTPEKIGTLTTLEDCVPSQYGDKHLYFRHQRIEEDWQIRTDWYDANKDGLIHEQCGFAVETLTPPSKCNQQQEMGQCL